MRYFLIVVVALIWVSSAFGGDYVTVTKQPDGSYVLEFSGRGRVVLDEMEHVEGANSLEMNTHNLMNSWDRRIKKEAREAATEEMRKIKGPLTHQQMDRINQLLEKAR